MGSIQKGILSKGADHFLQMTRMNTDALTMPESAWDVNSLIGLSSYYIESEFTIRTNLTSVNDRQIFGNVSFTAQPNRLGITFQTSSNILIYHGTATATITNFQNTYLGQKIKFRLEFVDNLSTGMVITLKINGIVISSGSVMGYLTTGSTPYAWVNAIGLNNVADTPRPGSFSDVDYHYLDFNGKKWLFDEGTGFDCFRSDGEIAVITTSHIDPLNYVNDTMRQP